MSQRHSDPGTPTAERVPAPNVIHDVSRLTDDDLYLFNEGTHAGLADKLGAHPGVVGDTAGTFFGVWAPNAEGVSVIGDFNGWDPRSHPLGARGHSGIWEGFAPGVGQGTLYKFHLVSRGGGWRADKTDPFATLYEPPPKTAAVVWDRSYPWGAGD